MNIHLFLFVSSYLLTPLLPLVASLVSNSIKNCTVQILKLEEREREREIPEKEGKLRPAAMIMVVEPVTGVRNTLSMIPRRSEMDRSQRHRKGDHGHRSQISPRGNNHRGGEIQKSIVNRALRHQISVYLGPSTRSDLLPITLWHKSLSFFSSHFTRCG